MIEAKELRIGNYIGLSEKLGDGIVLVGGLKIGNSNYKDRIRYKDNFIWNLLEDFNPVPLSEDILSKCGFIFDNDDSQAWRFNNFTLIRSADFEGKMIAVGHGITIDDKKRCCYISALHELQNLFYALTKQELNYQP